MTGWAGEHGPTTTLSSIYGWIGGLIHVDTNRYIVAYRTYSGSGSVYNTYMRLLTVTGTDVIAGSPVFVYGFDDNFFCGITMFNATQGVIVTAPYIQSFEVAPNGTITLGSQTSNGFNWLLTKDVRVANYGNDIVAVLYQTNSNSKLHVGLWKCDGLNAPDKGSTYDINAYVNRTAMNLVKVGDVPGGGATFVVSHKSTSGYTTFQGIRFTGSDHYATPTYGGHHYSTYGSYHCKLIKIDSNRLFTVFDNTSSGWTTSAIITFTSGVGDEMTISSFIHKPELVDWKSNYFGTAYLSPDLVYISSGENSSALHGVVGDVSGAAPSYSGFTLYSTGGESISDNTECIAVDSERVLMAYQQTGTGSGLKVKVIGS